MASHNTPDETPPERFTDALRRHARYSLAREWEVLTNREKYRIVALAVRDRLVEGMLRTEARTTATDAKRLCFLSMEFLMGRALGNNLLNLGLYDAVQGELANLGIDLAALEEEEADAALGNGGMGRLAACFLDSLATLDMPGCGYGINYEFGLFRQDIQRGQQREKPNAWRSEGSPWLIERTAESVVVPVYGRVEHNQDRQGHYNPLWLDWRIIIGVPSDLPIAGHGGRTVNYLRLYSARASGDFDMPVFNAGDYFRALEQKMSTEALSKVLYPSDSALSGRELRLVQEYFLVACAMRDIMRRFREKHDDPRDFPKKIAVQLNDTNPALAVLELMRILMDEHALPWDEAWTITHNTFGYTNHTLLPEAFEKWPVDLLERVLPRHLQLLYEINRRFLDHVRGVWPTDEPRVQRLSLVEEGPERQVRMAHLAVVGSHSVNGVAELHTHLLKTTLLKDFYALWPDRFNNKTNGVTQRRWLLHANPALARLITDSIGTAWVTDLSALRELEPLATDPAFQSLFFDVRRGNKKRLADRVRATTGVKIDPSSLFDVQAKRVHEYKRQLLNVLHVIHEYLSIVEDHREPVVPHTRLFAGKAAPGYWMAKLIVKLIHDVARTVNSDPAVGDRMRVVFVPDYGVSLASVMIPGADMSEQISTAGTEASGTGNMKFMMNGALTIGTMDGATIEMMQEVGAANMFLFGLTAEQIDDLRTRHAYSPADVVQAHPFIGRVLEAIRSGRFCPGEPDLFHPICRTLLNQGDPYFLLADLPSYDEAQVRAADIYQNREEWVRRAVLNVSRAGKFSSDRTIREYANQIWNLAPLA